jgi:hypothetical protein
LLFFGSARRACQLQQSRRILLARITDHRRCYGRNAELDPGSAVMHEEH